MKKSLLIIPSALIALAVAGCLWHQMLPDSSASMISQPAASLVGVTASLLHPRPDVILLPVRTVTRRVQSLAHSPSRPHFVLGGVVARKAVVDGIPSYEFPLPPHGPNLTPWRTRMYSEEACVDMMKGYPPGSVLTVDYGAKRTLTIVVPGGGVTQRSGGVLLR